MTKAQREVFERICINDKGPFHPEPIKALLAKSLILSELRVVGRDNFGQISIPEYHVPLPIHAQWCEWCSEQR